MKISSLGFLASAFISSSLCASSYVLDDAEAYNTYTTLSSIPLLQSLRHHDAESTFTVPHIQQVTNRLDIPSLLVQQHNLPMVDIQLTFNAGSSRDVEIGDQLYGLANLTAKLLDDGTTRYSAQELETRFEDLGAKLAISAQRDMFILRLRSLSEPSKLHAALDLVLHIIENANFEKSSIQLSNNNLQVGQKQLQENPSRLMGIRFYRAIYNQHPYAEPITGTLGSNRKIKPEHLKQFRDTFLVSKNLNLAFTGDLNLQQASSLTNKIAQQLKLGTKAKSLPSASLQDDFAIYHLPSTSSQAHVMMGHLGSINADQDRLSLELANRMFGGGGFNAILLQELRVKRGLTYAANSNMSFSQAPGVFSMSYGTRQDQLMQSLEIAHKALVDFATQPIHRAQLEATKSGMLLAFPNRFNSNANTNAVIGSMGFYGLDPSYIENYQKNLKAIDTAQVEAALRKYLHPDKLTLVIASQHIDKALILSTLQRNLKSATQ